MAFGSNASKRVVKNFADDWPLCSKNLRNLGGQFLARTNFQCWNSDSLRNFTKAWDQQAGLRSRTHMPRVEIVALRIADRRVSRHY